MRKFDRIVDEVGQDLSELARLALDHDLIGRLKLQLDSRFFGDGFKHFDRPLNDLSQPNRFEGDLGRGRFGFRKL